MKKKATTRKAKAASRQPSLNFPASSEPDIPDEDLISRDRSSAKKVTADFTDDTDQCDSSVTSALSVVTPSAPTERKAIAQGKNRSAAALGHFNPSR